MGRHVHCRSELKVADSTRLKNIQDGKRKNPERKKRGERQRDENEERGEVARLPDLQRSVVCQRYESSVLTKRNKTSQDDLLKPQ